MYNTTEILGVIFPDVALMEHYVLFTKSLTAVSLMSFDTPRHRAIVRSSSQCFPDSAADKLATIKSDHRPPVVAGQPSVFESFSAL